MKKDDLKRVCFSKNLSVGGNVADLKERLRSASRRISTFVMEDDSL